MAYTQAQIIKTIYEDQSEDLGETVPMILDREIKLTKDFARDILTAKSLGVGLDDQGELKDINAVTAHISSSEKSTSIEHIKAKKQAVELLQHSHDAFIEKTNAGYLGLVNFGLNLAINLPKTLLVTSLRVAIRVIPIAIAAVCATPVALFCAAENTYKHGLFKKGLLDPGGYEFAGDFFNMVYSKCMLSMSKDNKLSSIHDTALTRSSDVEFSFSEDLGELGRDMVDCLLKNQHVSLLKFGQRFDGPPIFTSLTDNQIADLDLMGQGLRNDASELTSNINNIDPGPVITNPLVSIKYDRNLDVGDESPYKQGTNWNQLNRELKQQHKNIEEQRNVIGNKGNKSGDRPCMPLKPGEPGKR